MATGGPTRRQASWKFTIKKAGIVYKIQYTVYNFNSRFEISLEKIFLTHIRNTLTKNQIRQNSACAA